MRETGKQIKAFRFQALSLTHTVKIFIFYTALKLGLWPDFLRLLPIQHIHVLLTAEQPGGSKQADLKHKEH